MRPRDIQSIGNELAVKWDDGVESFIPLEALRRGCPCAECRGETDILGNVYRKPEDGNEQRLPPDAFQLRRIVAVGGYAVQLVWTDGHATGIYSFEYLKRMAAENPSE